MLQSTYKRITVNPNLVKMQNCLTHNQLVFLHKPCAQMGKKNYIMLLCVSCLEIEGGFGNNGRTLHVFGIKLTELAHLNLEDCMVIA